MLIWGIDMVWLISYNENTNQINFHCRENEEMNLTKENSWQLGFLVQTSSDEKEFKDFFWQGDARQFFSISAYRRHKIKQMNMGFEEFHKLFDKNEILSIQDLFQQPIDDYTANRILNKIAGGDLTSKIIYDMFIDEERQLNVARLVHDRVR
jgi:hypothetical protein